MIRLVFIKERETYSVEIIGKEIYYSDRKLKKRVRIVPVDETIHRQIIMSRNKLPKWIIQFYNLTDEEKKEYEKCKNEEELAEVCIKDCKLNGSILLKKDGISL